MSDTTDKKPGGGQTPPEPPREDAPGWSTMPTWLSEIGKPAPPPDTASAPKATAPDAQPPAEAPPPPPGMSSQPPPPPVIETQAIDEETIPLPPPGDPPAAAAPEPAQPPDAPHADTGIESMMASALEGELGSDDAAPPATTGTVTGAASAMERTPAAETRANLEDRPPPPAPETSHSARQAPAARAPEPPAAGRSAPPSIAAAAGAAAAALAAGRPGAAAPARTSATTAPPVAPRRKKTPAAPPVIDINHLSLTFVTNDGPVHALADVSLNVAPGEFVSLIGPSGCGKTTLLRVIADLERPTAGHITVNGCTPEDARKARAYGYVFQAPALFPWRNIASNVALPLEIMGLGVRERDRRVSTNMELVNLKGFEKKFPWQLSGGMQQRASIARALAVEPDLMLMDEPFGALDEIVRDHLNVQLHQLWAQTKKTVVFVTHSIPEAVFLSTKIVVMTPRPGKIHDIIDSPLPRERQLDLRDSRSFLEVAQRVRDGLKAGHAYED